MTQPAPDPDFVAPPPTARRLFDIVALNDSAGGRRILAACRPDPVVYKMPNGRKVTFYTSGCGSEARISVPYRDAAGHEDAADVCINDDACHLWPRFNGAAEGRGLEPA